MTAPDWAALVQQTRDRIDQAEKTAKDATQGQWEVITYNGETYEIEAPIQDSFGGYCAVSDNADPEDASHIASWGSPDVALRMAAWARDVLDRHVPLSVGHLPGYWCSCESPYRDCREVTAVLRAWVPDLLTAAGDES